MKLRQLEKPEEALSWRMEVISAVFGSLSETDRGGLMRANDSFIRRYLGNLLVMCVVSIDNDDVGCGALCIQNELPSPDNPSGVSAYLMNIYVRSGYRNQGVGRYIVNELICLARVRGCGKIYLETTDEARGLYSEIGFGPLNDMMKL